ncbi:DUF4123 domain-containing protein [Vreelandella populi]|uniref:DUF4123 domain-containing protein n=1 Tax=Vreelandella populi TaxID=2498858 RepID=A0A433L8Y7_9GAMM|nr:DUF4123 domain-containing protein [Halomonas populi]RUR40146.1 DUF4123 domain-containing protein [Halomonas populi]RUR43950.1 DUF4123 domain-containing protein [Halomonas populi]
MRYALNLPKQSDKRYWLVDTASLPESEVLCRFYAIAKQPDFRWLYDGTPYQTVRDSGPVLLDITHDDSVWHQCSFEWAGVAASAVIDTSESLDALQERLANSLTIQTPGGGFGLLRFHEPALLHLLLGEELFSPGNRLALAGENACWHWPLCQHQGDVLHERYDSVNSTGIEPSETVKLNNVTQQRLAGLRQFSRLTVLLGEAISRFDLLQTEEDITFLWRELEHYWHATWKVSLKRKQAVEKVESMLARSDTLEQFVEELSAYVNAPLSVAMTR